MLVGACAAILFVAGCSGNNGTPEPTTPAASSSAAVTTTSVTPLRMTTSEAPAPTTTVEAVTAEPAVQKPYVVECLDGTPGPAKWSDGSMAFSQWCFDQHGGNEYLQQEREVNTFECDGQVCRNPYTGGSYPDPNAVAPPSVGTTSDRGYSCSGDRCYWPDGSPVPNYQRCGTQCGEAPTSGEIQTRHGCETGYITDPELCAGLGN